MENFGKSESFCLTQAKRTGIMGWSHVSSNVRVPDMSRFQCIPYVVILLACVFNTLFLSVTPTVGQSAVVVDSIEKAEKGDFAHASPIPVRVIDGWNDIPLFCYHRSMLRNSGVVDVIVWKDGRIAWREVNKFGVHCFKGNVSSQKISDALKELSRVIERETTLSGKHAVSRKIPLVSDPSVLGMVFSDEHFKSDIWSQVLLGRYEEVRESFQVRERGAMIGAMDKIWGNSRMLRDGILSMYREEYHRKMDRRQRYSHDEVYAYAERFSADADYFLLFEQLIKGMIPTDGGLSSDKSRIETKYVSVKKDVDGRYIYEFVDRFDKASAGK